MEELAGSVIDVAALAGEAAEAGKAGLLWSVSTADLHVNVLRFAAGDGVPEHVNNEVDVLLLVVCGEEAVTLDGRALPETGRRQSDHGRGTLQLNHMCQRHASRHDATLSQRTRMSAGETRLCLRSSPQR